jgi:hypothetical protein
MPPQESTKGLSGPAAGWVWLTVAGVIKAEAVPPFIVFEGSNAMRSPHRTLPAEHIKLESLRKLRRKVNLI